MGTNISDVRYVACWPQDGGIYSCGCDHLTVKDAMECLVRDGRHFIRARENGELRSLNEDELGEFIVQLVNRPAKGIPG